jgi:hypothetical protein
MVSQLIRDRNLNKYVTKVWWGLMWLVLEYCRKHGEFLDTSVAQNWLSHNHSRHVLLQIIWATFKTLSEMFDSEYTQNALLSFQVHSTTILHDIWRYNFVILNVIGAHLCVCNQQLVHSFGFQAPHLLYTSLFHRYDCCYLRHMSANYITIA